MKDLNTPNPDAAVTTIYKTRKPYLTFSDPSNARIRYFQYERILAPVSILAILSVKTAMAEMILNRPKRIKAPMLENFIILHFDDDESLACSDMIILTKIFF